MTFDEYKDSLSATYPPELSNDLLVALWYDAKGNWDKSHSIAQDIETGDGSWVHGYLHRKEGDDGNAGYWYRRAGRKFPEKDLDSEWEEIVRELLE